MDYFPEACFAVFFWWFSTGLVLYLNGLSAHTFPRTMIAASLLSALALVGLNWSATQETVIGAYLSFSCGLLLYAWQELSYYMGIITGPRKTACRKGCRGWRHFGHALQTNLYHELATIAGAVIIILLSRDAPNQVGMWTYLMLWLMQLSAKLNVFLGVRNLSEEFLPAHMQHLKSFLRRKSMNLLFPFSVTGGTILSIWLVRLMLDSDPGTFEAAGWAFLASLMILALLEHWFLVIPLPASVLWQGWLNRRNRADSSQPPSGNNARRGKLPASGHGLFQQTGLITGEGKLLRNKTGYRSATNLAQRELGSPEC